jgi:hypothetical protein
MIEICPETAEAQLQECLDDMTGACQKVFADGLVKKVHDNAIGRFTDNVAGYPAARDTVRTSARCIGIFAQGYAEFRKHVRVHQDDAESAIEIVAGMCLAMGFTRLRARWCPDVPLQDLPRDPSGTRESA